MAWTKKSQGKMITYYEQITLPSSATTEYSDVIKATDIGPDLRNNNRYVTFTFNASAVTGTNLDISLYVSRTQGGTKVQILDAVVADITATGVKIAVVDINAYPGPFYYLAWLSDADESSNTIDVEVYAQT
jgi:hypothetical protein